MKKRWNKRKGFLEGISYPARTAFNLFWVVFFLWAVWMRAGCPLPTEELEFRRMERTHLLSPGEIVFAANARGDKQLLNSSSEDRSVFALDGTELRLRDRWFVSLGESWAAVARVSHDSWNQDFWTVPLEEDGPTLLPLTIGHGYGYWFEEDYTGGAHYICHNFFPLLLVNVPAETDRAEVTVEQEGLSVTGPGWNLGNGVWLLTPDNQVLPHRPEAERAYRYQLFRADGSLLLERSGSLEEPV